MKDYRKNFKLLLERMENKYTLNEVNNLLTESIGGGIIKYINDVKSYNSESLKSIMRSFGVSDLMQNTKGSFDDVLKGLDDITKQLEDLKIGRFVENFNAKNAIFANLKKLTSNFVDAELLRIPELRGLDDVEIGNLKSWLMGNNVSFPSKIDINSDLYKSLLNPHRTKMMEYLTIAQMTDAINSINKFVNKGDKVNLKSLLSGQLNLKELNTLDLNSLFDDLIKLDELFTKKISVTDDAGNVVKVDAFPDFASIWEKFRLDLGLADDVALNKEFLNAKLIDEAKNTNLNILDVKNRGVVMTPIRKKYKNIPKIAVNKSRGKLTESDFNNAVVVKNPKDGSVDIYIFKNDKSKKQLENLFKQYGVNSENWDDFVKSIGGDVSDISKKLTKWRRISIILGGVAVGVPILIPIGLLAWCMSLDGQAIKEEDLNLLKDEDGIDKEKAGQYIGKLMACGKYAISYGTEVSEPVIRFIWNDEIKPFLIIGLRKIENKIREICEKNKTENGTECCVLNCDNIQEEIGDESKGYIMDSLGHPLVMEYIKKQGSNVKNIIDKFDKENKLDGILFTESGDVDINEIIRHQCIKIQKENSECIKSSIETVWNSIFEEDNDCTNWLENKKSKIDNLRKYEQFIEFENRVCTDADNTEGEELKVKFCLNNLPKTLRNDVITQAPTLDSFENLEKLMDFQYKVSVQPLCAENNSIVDEKFDVEVDELPTYDTLKDYVMSIWDQTQDGEGWRNCDNYNPTIFDNTTEEGQEEYNWFWVSFGENFNDFTKKNEMTYESMVDEAWEWLGMTKNNYCKNK
jgi:hypothetical protein